MQKTSVCDLDTGVNWWLEESDLCTTSSGPRRLYCNGIAHAGKVKKKNGGAYMRWK